MIGVYDDQGIRFEYPPDWELEVSDDGPRTTVAVQAPGGLAFTMITVDETCPAPAELAAPSPGSPTGSGPSSRTPPAVPTSTPRSPRCAPRPVPRA